MSSVPNATALIDDYSQCEIIEWCRRFAAVRGSRFVHTESALWFESSRFIFDSFPPHRAVTLGARERAYLFSRGAAIVRHACNDTKAAESFEFVCDNKNYGFESLFTDARRRVRRGLDACRIQPIDFELLARCGCEINRSVLARQDRGASSFLADLVRWVQYTDLCAQFQRFEAFGAFVNETLAAFIVTLRVDDYCYLYHTHAHSDYLKFSPMNALLFEVTREMLSRPAVRRVSQGLQPLLDRPELSRFKLAMGYRQSPIRRCLLINPALRPLLSWPGSSLVRAVLSRAAKSKLPAFEGLTRALAQPPNRLASVTGGPGPN